MLLEHITYQAPSEGVRLVRSNPPPLSRQQYMYTVTVAVLAVNCLTFLLKYNWICTKMSYFKWKVPKFSIDPSPMGRETPLPTPYPLGAYGPSAPTAPRPPTSGMSGYGPAYLQTSCWEWVCISIKQTIIHTITIRLTKWSMQHAMESSLARSEQNVCHPVVLSVRTETLPSEHQQRRTLPRLRHWFQGFPVLHCQVHTRPSV